MLIARPMVENRPKSNKTLEAITWSLPLIIWLTPFRATHVQKHNIINTTCCQKTNAYIRYTYFKNL